MVIRTRPLIPLIAILAFHIILDVQITNAQNRFATSDSMSGYVHWIDLYDATNTRIDPSSENAKPYSPEKTCGRCHEFDSISHGWHFNATESDAEHGRPGQPWIWSDNRTGTHLPLSYRGWPGTHHPDDLGLSRWQVAAKLGGFMPGGGVGSAAAISNAVENATEDRSKVTGELPVDCMMCHRNQGSGYSPFIWTEQIEGENFSYAPSAALGIAVVEGNMSRLKDDFDPTAEDATSKLPKLSYESSKFRSDGKVFFDLVRKPKNDACYYCHTNTAADAVEGQRWLHDEDVHLRAGLACADCHRNSIDHLTVRGFEGETHPAGSLAASLSCQGCHVGNGPTDDQLASPGRLGAPMPAHRGLPPVHFEKLTCTACHSGPVPGDMFERQINSIAHRLGEHIKRTGEEQPGILAGMNLPVAYPLAHAKADTSELAHASDHDSAPPAEASQDENTVLKYTPHRMMWPAFWGTLTKGQVTVLNPDLAYDIVRKGLKVRREFAEELAEVKLSLTQRKELLGDERARVKEEDRTPEEITILAAAEAKDREIQIGERMAAALAAIEEEYPDSQAVYVSGGMGFVRKGDTEIETLDSQQLGAAAAPYAWPLAHNVRPARQSLGATGCLECHSEGSSFFQAEVLPVGTLPNQETTPVRVHELQNADMLRLSTWNQLFAGRSLFKIAGIVALAMTCIVALSAMAWNLGGLWRKE